MRRAGGSAGAQHDYVRPGTLATRQLWPPSALIKRVSPPSWSVAVAQPVAGLGGEDAEPDGQMRPTSNGTAQYKLRTYTGPSVLVVDELYLPLDKASANWIFQVVSRR